MKKKAILILCGEEYERLPFLVEQFDDRFNIYIPFKFAYERIFEE